MIKAVIFDFDGTILDSETCGYEAFCDLYAEYGLELRLEEWALCIGTHGGPFEPYDELEKRSGRKLDRAALKDRYETELMNRSLKMELLPGVRETLEEARQLGLRIGLASSSHRDWIDRHLEEKGIRGFFQTIQTADDVEKVKPDPALYRQAAAALGVRPEEAVAIEDSRNGLLGAKAAGLKAVVVPNPMTRHMDFESAGVDLVLDSLAGRKLRDILAQLESAENAR
ncbi:HAD family hydrolase [Cohnella caldifontis]|uniref:HAD family hydrolase n=1 Tax=Cohnella caldifontis TaxID=3027471 RepID=UPI0023EDA8D0|nr:HAD family hydrolase [Cohnella sp. YIM B05605]